MTATTPTFADRAAKVIRVLPIPPVGAFTLVTSLYIKRGAEFGTRLSYLFAVLFLSLVL